MKPLTKAQLKAIADNKVSKPIPANLQVELRESLESTNKLVDHSDMVYEEWVRGNRTFVQVREFDADDCAFFIAQIQKLPGYSLRLESITLWF